MSNSRTRSLPLLLSLLFPLLAGSFSAPLSAQELPRPTLDNSLVVSIEHLPTDAPEVDYIKANFPFGLYAWLSFSVTTVPINMSWTQALDPAAASAGIAAFKTQVNAYVAAAKAKKVRLHLVLTSGLARNLSIYKPAKIEDIRNAQWYNDNKLASDAQIAAADPMAATVMGTLSRYARKVRANLYAKSKAAVEFLKQVMDANPDTLVAISAWGEAELNFNRINHSVGLQEFFCDFSPFAVLEFRDWIQHTGLYDDATGTYRAQGFPGGGAKYQGDAGLAQFNADYGTAFTSWNLRYFNWSLADDYDQDPTDGTNPDPRRIPYSSYVHGQMMPTAGQGVIEGGFDPPRVMTPGNAFWELWRMFRETMVRNFTRDMAFWASTAGLPASRYYSHQIPGDYLYDTRPSDYANNNNNPRYYSSASPLWSADIAPYGSAGATIYDIKFPESIRNPVFARTTYWILPVIQALSANWAIMEYDAETYPPGMGVVQSTPDVILSEYLRIYNHQVHLINFWRWTDGTGEHQFKGMNKETALREFIRKVRDKARATDLNTVFTPPKPAGLAGAWVGGTTGVRLTWADTIWADLSWKWTDWGDHHHFEIYRGDRRDFSADAAHAIGTISSFSFDDAAAVPGTAYYYKIRAFNSLGASGPASDAVLVSTASTAAPILTVDKTALFFGAVTLSDGTPGQSVRVVNAGTPGTALVWTALSDRPWLTITPPAGVGNGSPVIRASGLALEPGIHTGRVTIADPSAFLSPQFVDVTISVAGEGGDSPPFGGFDSPSAGTAWSGSIPVTGWALDDIEVRKVEIKRDSDPSDPEGAVGPDGLVYIGDAIFVEGARPDVELAHPGLPLNDRAGWGYMLLSNFLPNGGNGTYRLYAFAVDSASHRVELGRVTFTSDNAHRTKPFGTIDTPAQGGTASGNQYVNFGWALTALPDIIPFDGTTILVWVDGLALGHPVYNNFRADVAANFPGLANTDGAVGYYFLDTTAYENGVHTIAWTVADSGGDADGIGSRYFTIENSGVPPGMPAAGVASRLFVMPQGDSAPVFVQTGFSDAAGVERVPPGPDGWVDVTVSALDRLVFYLDPEAAGLAGAGASGDAVSPRRALLGRPDRNPPGDFAAPAFSGFLQVGTEYRPLPVGSSFDPAGGVFAWQIGPGFLGEFKLVFVKKSGRLGTQRTLVRVRVQVRRGTPAA